MEFMYNVQVDGKGSAVFDTAEEAVKWARSNLYMQPYKHQIAIDTLEQGAMFTYSYGFAECFMMPVMKRRI